MRSITLKAHAKVNLFLKVLSKRRDSYHNIHTLFERISLYDTIRISRASKGITVSSDRPVTKNPKDNLVYKAALAMIRRARLKGGVKIEITKRIPVAAGLGGGSSDAAAVILGMNDLFDLGLKTKALMKIGSSIGADVPFFVSGARFATGKGIGGNLNIIDTDASLWHLLVFPAFKVDTRSVYKAYDSVKMVKSNRLTCKIGGAKIVSSLTDYRAVEKALYNDLERASISKNRIIGGISKGLAQLLGKKFIVSGSGPSLFCLYGTGKEASSGKRAVLKGFSPGDRAGWRIFAVKTA